MQLEVLMKKLFLLFFTYCFCTISVVALQKEYFSQPVYDEATGVPLPQDNSDYDNFAWNVPFSEWYEGGHFFGGLGDLRSDFENVGFVPVVSYVGNFAGNAIGGNSRGVAHCGAFQIAAGLDLYKLTEIKSLKGWNLVNVWNYRFGDSLTKKRLGNTFSVQQIYGNQTMMLQSLYLSYANTIVGGEYDVMFKIGRISAGDNFLTKPIYWLYQNNAFNGNPVGVFNQARFSDVASTWGAMGRITDSEGRYFKAGVYQINTPKQNSRDMHGLEWSMKCEGVNANFELGWDINHDDSGKSPANISVGIVSDWYNAPYVDASGRNGTYNCSIYLQADYMIWNMGYIKNDNPRYIVRDKDKYRDIRGIILWGVFQYCPYDELAKMPYFVNGGILFNAPFESRADDVLCFGFAYGKYSDEMPSKYRDSHEAVLELNYKFQLNRFMFVQPNIQYVMTPVADNAVVFGMQYGINF